MPMPIRRNSVPSASRSSGGRAASNMRWASWVASDSDRLRLYELWLKTGSERSRNLLRKLGLEPAEGARSVLAH